MNSEREEVVVLVIEDDDDDWKLIERALKKATRTKFTFDRVAYLNDGLTAIQNKKYDIILLDLVLKFDGPQNGLDTVVQVARKATSIPIVVLSSMGDIEVAVQTVDNGASAFIQKPPDSRFLESVIRQSIERQVTTEIARRLIHQSISRYADDDGVSAAGVLLGGHIDVIEAAFHYVRGYLRNTSPESEKELFQAMAWTEVAVAFREMRSILKLSSPEDRDTWPPPTMTEFRKKKTRRSSISERAMQRISHTDLASIKTHADAEAYLLKVLSTGSGGEGEDDGKP